MICDNIACGCAVISDTLVISGSGTPSDPWRLEQAQFTDITALQVDVANIQATLATLPGIYVDVTGDSMSGELSISNPSGRALKLVEAVNGLPFLDFRDGGNARCGYLQGRTTTDATPGVRLASDSGDPVRLNIGNVDRVIMDATNLLLYKAATGIGTTGLEMGSTGTLWVTRAATGVNITSNKTSTANADGQIHMSIQSAGTEIGKIIRFSSASATFVTSSDRDLKENIEPIDDELALLWLRTIEPVFYNFISDPDAQRRVGYIAQDLAELWPNGVGTVISAGHGNVEDRTWDDDGNETTPREVWEPWMIDYSAAAPILHSGLQALDRVQQARTIVIADHENRIETLEAVSGVGDDSRLVALETSVAALQTTVAAQATRITTLEGKVAAQASTITALQSSVAAHTTRIVALEAAAGNESTDVAAAVGKLRNEVYYTRSTTAGWQYSNTTSTPPGNGQIRSNSPLTNLYISKTDTDGYNRSMALSYIVTSTLYDPKSCRIRIRTTNGAVFEVRSTGPATDNTTWVNIPVEILSGSEGSKGTRVEITMLSEIWAEDPPPMPTTLPSGPEPEIEPK